jgi:hypothetical protein
MPIEQSKCIKEGWVAKLEGWVAKSLARQLATAVLWMGSNPDIPQKS